MQNSVAPAACERRAASTMPSTSSQAARTGVGKRADCEQNAQSSLQPPVLADTIDSTETSGPQCARRTRWASAHSSGTRSGAQRRDAHGVLARERLAAAEHLLLDVRAGRSRGETIAGAGQPSGSQGSAPSSGAMRRSSVRFVRSATSGSALVPHTITPATAMPRARATSTVSAVWLSVPRPGRATISSGSSSASARSANVSRSLIGTSSPPEPSTRMAPAAARSSRAAATIGSRLGSGAPSRRAATAGATAAS